MTQPSTQEKKTVIVVGGGVGGLSAAHELVKKGFHVIVYDRRKEEQLGGKARSLKLEGDEAPPYGEHGFRFFPAFYRHLVDTMSEIPYGDGGNVAENLVSADAVLFTSYEVPPFSLPLNLPWKSFQEVVDSTKFLASFLNLGLKGRDFAHYLCRMGEMLTSCDGRRAEFEQMSWWQFLLGQAPPARNVAYKDFSPFERYIAIGMTRNLVAAKAEEANALTVGRVGMQLLLSVFWPWRLWCRIVGDGFTPPGDVDRLLNGPTNEVWINPWIKHLKQQQVEFRTNVNLERIVFDPATRRVTGLEFAPAPKIHNRVYQVAQAKAVAAGLGPLTVMDLKTKHADLIKQAELEVLQEAKVPNAPAEVKDAIAAPTNADYYVFALPVEQMAKFAPTPMVEADERLQCVMALQDHVEWMTGLQYFLREPLGLTRGHHDHLDSEWALTSVEQTMFWSDDQNGPFDHGIKSVLSVDISEWGKVGTSIGKVASNCTPSEIAEEVWVQLKKSLNKGGRSFATT